MPEVCASSILAVTILLRKQATTLERVASRFDSCHGCKVFGQTRQQGFIIPRRIAPKGRVFGVLLLLTINMKDELTEEQKRKLREILRYHIIIPKEEKKEL